MGKTDAARASARMTMQLLEAAPAAVPSKTFLERALFYRQETPVEDWDGGYVAKSK